MMIWPNKTLFGEKEEFNIEIFDLFLVAKMQHKSLKIYFSAKI